MRDGYLQDISTIRENLYYWNHNGSKEEASTRKFKGLVMVIKVDYHFQTCRLFHFDSNEEIDHDVSVFSLYIADAKQ